MKIYLGSRELKPEGFISLDISPEHHPDIVADVAHMPEVADRSCSEVVASHVLEHLVWPDSFAALAEMARILRPGGILRLAVPDLKLMAELIVAGHTPFFAAGMLFGLGAGTDFADRHHYGFSAEMLLPILRYLGFADFEWWNSTLPEGANGWFPHDGDKLGVSLNVRAVKAGSPLADPALLYRRLADEPMREFDSVLAEVLENVPAAEDLAPRLYQRIHYQLIEARQRIAFLEEELRRRTAGAAPGEAK